jgi:hypothetical protein
MKTIPAETLQEIVVLANNLRAAQEEVARLTVELWKRCLVLRPSETPAKESSEGEEAEGLIDLNTEVIKNVLKAAAPPAAAPTPERTPERPCLKDKHAGAETMTNKIMLAIFEAKRPLRADEIHTAIGSTSTFASTQSTMSSLSNSGFLTKDDRQRPALWSLALRGLDRVRRIKEQGR